MFKWVKEFLFKKEDEDEIVQRVEEAFLMDAIEPIFVEGDDVTYHAAGEDKMNGEMGTILHALEDRQVAIVQWDSKDIGTKWCSYINLYKLTIQKGPELA